MAAAPSPLPQRCSHQPCPQPLLLPLLSHFWLHSFAGRRGQKRKPPAQLSPLQHRLRQLLPLRDPEQMEPKGFGLPASRPSPFSPSGVATTPLQTPKHTPHPLWHSLSRTNRVPKEPRPPRSPQRPPGPSELPPRCGALTTGAGPSPQRRPLPFPSLLGAHRLAGLGDEEQGQEDEEGAGPGAPGPPPLSRLPLPPRAPSWGHPPAATSGCCAAPPTWPPGRGASGAETAVSPSLPRRK